jgi:hypothetical protein
MSRKGRIQLFGGLLVLALGVLLLVWQVLPGLGDIFEIAWSWPLTIVAVGGGLLLLGLLIGAPGMAVPACIVAGIGGILYYQNATGDWASWAFVWTLIPGFSGVGIILSGLLGEDTRRSVRGGATTAFISAILFFVVGAATGRIGWLGGYWPLLLVGWGLVIILRTLFRKRW